MSTRARSSSRTRTVTDEAVARAKAETARIRGYFSRAAGSWGRWPVGRSYLATERQDLMLRAIRTFVARDVVGMSVCDVGCGDGGDLSFWRDAGVPVGSLAGTEIVAENARKAHSTVAGADIRLVDSFELPFEDGRFLVTTASLVLSTILDSSLRRKLFQEMVRVTAPEGVVLVYDFKVRKPGNRNVLALNRRRARLLGGGPPYAEWHAAPFLPALPAVLRLPPLVRRLGLRLLPRTHVLYAWPRSPGSITRVDVP